MAESDELFPTAAVALAFGFTSSGWMAMVRRTGCIPVVRVGKRAMFRRSDIEALLSASIEVRPWKRTTSDSR